jgi:hypothetical protein
MKIRFHRKHIWLWLGLAAIVLRIIFGFFPAICEQFYSRGLFLAIRWSFDHSTAYLPFAPFYIFFSLLILWAFYRIYRMYRNRKTKRTWRAWALATGKASADFLGGGIFIFLLIWGYNYARIPIETQIQIDARKLYVEELREEANYIMQAAAQARAEIGDLADDIDTFALSEADFPTNLENEMRNCLVQVLEDFGYPTIGRVRGRQLYPPGFLYGFNSSGVYMPFVGEGHIESALHILQKPFTLAHEMAHGYGFGDEGTCNFLGYLACLRSEYPAIRYAGQLNYWRYVFGELSYSDYLYYKNLRDDIDRGMYNDLEAIYSKMDQYFEFVPGLQAIAYEAYLQMQGVKEGLQSYDRMVLMVVAMRRKGMLED